MSFEKWWNDSLHNFSKDFPSDRWLAKECYKAGMLRAAEIAEVVDMQCTNNHTDYCEGWNASECPNKSMAFCVSTAIRKEAEK